MRRLSVLAALAISATLAPAGQAADARHPTVVELYQSQGCSSCPPAAANLNALAGRPDILALSFGVTYWDYLGWKDIYASPKFTARQWDYARGLRRGNVATPQVVINGRTDVIGNDRRSLDAAIARADRGTGGPSLELASTKVSVAGSGTGDVWLVRFDPRTVNVPVNRGENGGRTLPHRNVVKQLVKLGPWAGKPISFALPAATETGLGTAVFIQAGTGGPIIAAVRG
jgi:hypothetical protein